MRQTHLSWILWNALGLWGNWTYSCSFASSSSVHLSSSSSGGICMFPLYILGFLLDVDDLVFVGSEIFLFFSCVCSTLPFLTSFLLSSACCSCGGSSPLFFCTLLDGLDLLTIKLLLDECSDDVSFISEDGGDAGTVWRLIFFFLFFCFLNLIGEDISLFRSGTSFTRCALWMDLVLLPVLSSEMLGGSTDEWDGSSPRFPLTLFRLRDGALVFLFGAEAALSAFWFRIKNFFNLLTDTAAVSSCGIKRQWR